MYLPEGEGSIPDILTFNMLSALMPADLGPWDPPWDPGTLVYPRLHHSLLSHDAILAPHVVFVCE